MMSETETQSPAGAEPNVSARTSAVWPSRKDVDSLPVTKVEVQTTSAIAPAPQTAAAGSETDPGWQVEEFFQGIVEERAEDSVRVSITSSGGEEASAWIKLADIDVTERSWAEVGAPIRVSILTSTIGTRRRTQRIRFLRPSQYHPSARQRELMADLLRERVRAVLAGDG